MFFANSTRRDPTPIERTRVAKLMSSRCAAFFLENTANKVIVATAKHCFFELSPTDWCSKDGHFRAGDGYHDGPVTDTTDGGDVAVTDGGKDPNDGWCQHIIASDDTHDIVVFEGKFDGETQHASQGDTTLRLAAYIPATGSPLTMIGFPADQDPATARNGAFTTTESCWTLTDWPDPSIHTENVAWSDRNLYENCTVYGGNSGGPIYIAGSRDVIGEPSAYANNYARRSPTDVATAAPLNIMSDFVALHHQELVSAGIAFSEAPPSDLKLVPWPASDPNEGVSASEAPSPTPEPKPAPAPTHADGGCAMSPHRTEQDALLVIVCLLACFQVYRRVSRTRTSPAGTRR
jgi:hypothetical protein